MESVSTLGFGSRVSEITLGQAKKNSESSQIFEAKEAAAKLERAAEAARVRNLHTQPKVASFGTALSPDCSF